MSLTSPARPPAPLARWGSAGALELKIPEPRDMILLLQQKGRRSIRHRRPFRPAPKRAMNSSSTLELRDLGELQTRVDTVVHRAQLVLVNRNEARQERVRVGRRIR